MKISTMLSYAGGFRQAAAQVAEMEKAGLDLVWVAEAYGIDSPSQMGYLAALTERVEIGSAILPIFTRTPTLIAMTAAGIDTLSEGRFHLGLGSSGPQVIEGWHGVPFDAPHRPHPRDHRRLPAGLGPGGPARAHEGSHYDMPLPAGRGPGWARRSRSSVDRCGPRIPIWVASLGEKNVAMTAEVADGWIPMLFVPEKARDVWGDVARRRAGQAGPVPRSAPDHRRAACWPSARATTSSPSASWPGPMVALYVGGHGSQGEELLQRRGPALRLRGGGREDPGPLPRRQEDRGRGAGAGRAARGDVAVRSRELRGRADRRLQGGRRQPPAGDAGAGRATRPPVDLIAKVKELAG